MRFLKTLKKVMRHLKCTALMCLRKIQKYKVGFLSWIQASRFLPRTKSSSPDISCEYMKPETDENGNRTFIVKDCRKILLNISVIGYDKKGESVLVWITDESEPKQEKKVKYSMVFDCWQENVKYDNDQQITLNKTLDLLQTYYINHIDLLCWTHPHDDHFMGLLEVVNSGRCSNKTKFLVPSKLEDNANLLKLSQYEKDILKSMHSFRNRNYWPVSEVSIAKDKGIQDIDDLLFSDELMNTFSVNIDCLAPYSNFISDLIDRKKNGNVKDIEMNDFSIALNMKFGPYDFNFCGDIEDKMARKIKASCFRHNTFIKVPHHTGNSAQFVETLIEPDKSALACTTIYQAGGDPNPTLVKRYKTSCLSIYSTGEHQTGDVHYGIVHYTFDLFGKQEVSIRREGHAVKL